MNSLAVDDYEAISVTLVIPLGSMSGATQCQDITIVDNSAFEKNESFFVILSSEPNVQVPDPNVTVTIIDNEGILVTKKVGFGRCSDSDNTRQ